MIAQCCVWMMSMTETFLWSVQWSCMLTVEMTTSMSVSCQIDYIWQASNQICVWVQSHWKECTITNVFYRNIVTCIRLPMGHRGWPHLGKGHQPMSQKTSVGGCYLFLKLGLLLWPWSLRKNFVILRTPATSHGQTQMKFQNQYRKPEC